MMAHDGEAARSGSRRRVLEPDVLTDREIAALIGACSRSAPTGLRNRAILVVAWRTGLRVSEILELWPKDVDLAEGTMVVRHGKGGRRRVVGLDGGTVEVIDRWLAARAARCLPDESPLFCTLRGGRVDASYIL